MSRNIIYNEWIPYTRYEKHECDIKCKDGTIIYHVYPNSGNFYLCCGKEMKGWNEEEVVEIMYRRYYSDNLCNGNCNKKSK